MAVSCAARCPRRHAIVQLKTLKYSARFPDRFGSLEDGKRFCREFVAWYNNVHRHSGIAMLPHATVHHGTADVVLDARHGVKSAAYAAHRDRFIAGEPRRRRLPRHVWIKQPGGRETVPKTQDGNRS